METEIKELRRPWAKAWAFAPAMVAWAAVLLASGALLMPLGTARATLLLFLQGLPVLLAVRRTWNVSALALAAGPAGLTLWSAAAPLSWMITPGAAAPVVLAAGGGAAAYLTRRRSVIRLTLNWLDVACLLFAAGLAVLIGWVASVNGPQPAGSYYLRASGLSDTMYLFGYIENSRVTSAYPEHSPFVPGSWNAYSTFFHAGLGALARHTAKPAAISLWWPYAALLLSNGLLIHAISQLLPRRPRVGQASLALAVAAVCAGIRIDLLVLPQTQGMVMPLLFLVLILIRYPAAGPRRAREWVAALVLTIGLCLGHVVTGLVGACFFGWFALDNLIRRPSRRRGWWQLAGAILASVILLINMIQPFSSDSISPAPADHLAYLRKTAGAWILPLLAFGVPVLVHCRRRPLKAGPFVSLIGLGFAYGVVSAFKKDQWSAIFGMFNAVRFYHFATLAATPFMVRMKWFVAMPLLAVAAFTAQTIAEIHVVITQKPEVVTRDQQLAYAFVREKLPADAVVLTNRPNYHLPAFTGRVSYMPSAENLYAQNMISDVAWEQHKRDYYDIFNPLVEPTRRIQALDQLWCRYLLIERAPGTPPALIAGNLLNRVPHRIVYETPNVVIAEIILAKAWFS